MGLKEEEEVGFGENGIEEKMIFLGMSDVLTRKNHLLKERVGSLEKVCCSRNSRNNYSL